MTIQCGTLRNGSRYQGFTLIETVLTITLIGIMAYVVISAFSFQTTRLDLAEDKLVRDIEYAKRLALTKGSRYGIFFEPANDRYTVFVTSSATPIPDPENRSQNLIVNYTSGSFAGVDVVSANFGGSTTLTFDAQGRPIDVALIPLVGIGTVVLQGGSVTRTITVSPNTGKVTAP